MAMRGWHGGRTPRRPTVKVGPVAKDARLAAESAASGNGSSRLHQGRIPLPHEVVALLNKEPEKAHPSLLLSRFVRWADPPGEGDRGRGSARGGTGDWTFKLPKGSVKADNLERVRRAVRSEDIQSLAKAWTERRKASFEALQRSGRGKVFEATLSWRLAVGMSGQGPLETGITLHRNYGVPYLPGSGVKGLAAAAAHMDTEDPDKRKDPVFGHAAASGDTGCAGLVIFHDAVPIPCPGKPVLLDLDILNPHFPGWYREGKPPADTDSPVPVPFLTVAPGTTFQFVIELRHGNRSGEAAAGVLDRAERWLRIGLEELGAGAKTSSGYGFFDVRAEPV